MIVRQKCIALLNSKPGAVAGSTKIIFVKMPRCIGSFHEKSRMHVVCGLRSKFNDTLNDTVAKVNQYILTITSCNAYEDFNKSGNLSDRGKTAFWNELNDLIQRFEHHKVKLLPNPKNPPKSKSLQHHHQNHQFSPSDWVHHTHHHDDHNGMRKLPTPPPHH